MLYIDKVAYASKLSNTSVREKFLFIFLPLLSTLFVHNNLLNIFLLLSMSAATLHFAKINFKNYLKLLAIPSGFVLVSIVTLCIVNATTTTSSIIFAFDIFGSQYALTTQSLSIGIAMFFRAIAGIACLYFFALNTPLNAVLAYLQRLGVSGMILTLMEFIYRFIFILYEQACITHTAQLSRMGHSSFSKSLHAYSQLFSCIFIRSFIKIDRVNNALIARGFNNNFHYCQSSEVHSASLQKITGVYALLIALGFCIERGYL